MEQKEVEKNVVQDSNDNIHTQLEAPINRIIPISVCLEAIVILIVLEIKNAVTKIKATTAIKHTL